MTRGMDVHAYARMPRPKAPFPQAGRRRMYVYGLRMRIRTTSCKRAHMACTACVYAHACIMQPRICASKGMHWQAGQQTTSRGGWP